MKRLTLLFFAGSLICSAQEFRLTRPAILKSERSIVSLKAGTIVDLISRDEKTLTVRFNNVTGVIPASCLADAPAATAAKPGSPKPAAPAQPSGSRYVNAVNKTKGNIAKHEQNDAKAVDEVLK